MFEIITTVIGYEQDATSILCLPTVARPNITDSLIEYFYVID